MIRLMNQELDRILDRHDVVGLVRVDVVDHRGQSGGFSGAGGPSHQDQPALLERNPLQDLGQNQLADRHHLERNHPQHRARRSPLLEHVDPEPSQARHAIGEVDLVGALEPLLLEIVHDPEHHSGDFLGRQSLPIFQGNQRAVDPEDRRKPGFEVDV